VSQILEQWIQGKGLPDTVVIDGHIHVGEWPHATTFQSVDEAERESNIYLDSNGVDAFCAVSGSYIFGLYDYRLGNDFLLKVWRRMPDRLIPFLCVNPNDSRKNILAELDRMYGEGVRCIKLINAYQNNYPGDGPNLMLVYEYAAQHKMLVFDHHWTEAEINFIAPRFPEVDFIFAHYSGGYHDTAMRAYDNVHTNIWNYGNLGWLDRGIQAAGARKFMMGSDAFLNCMSVGIGPVVFAPISDEDMRLVLGINTARLVHKVGALPAVLQRKCAGYLD
jgi:predicted TIM-barrel fold metal-dependent hydrolase